MSRNYGIDLMRIISMFYVIVLHTLGRGGVLGAVQPGSYQYAVAWLLEILAYCAVDIFGVISGYVGYRENGKHIHYAGYLELWLEVVAYGLAVTLLVSILRPELVTGKNFTDMCFPVTNGLYWYFTAYTGLVLFMPVLDFAVRSASVRTLKKLLLVIFIGFSVYGTVFGDHFGGSKGYSFIWLAILYLIGAIIRKCEIGSQITTGRALIYIAILAAITWLLKLIGKSVVILNVSVTGDTLISYISPTVLGMAMFYVMGASKLKVSERTSRVIEFCASGAFAAYILNCQQYIWTYVMKGRFVFLASMHSYIIPICVIAFSAVFIVTSILIDKVRAMVFRLLRVKSFARWVDSRAAEIVNRLI